MHVILQCRAFFCIFLVPENKMHDILKWRAFFCIFLVPKNKMHVILKKLHFFGFSGIDFLQQIADALQKVCN